MVLGENLTRNEGTSSVIVVIKSDSIIIKLSYLRTKEGNVSILILSQHGDRASGLTPGERCPGAGKLMHWD